MERDECCGGCLDYETTGMLSSNGAEVGKDLESWCCGDNGSVRDVCERLIGRIIERYDKD